MCCDGGIFLLMPSMLEQFVSSSVLPIYASYVGSINPARSFGTAAISGNWNDHWVRILTQYLPPPSITRTPRYVCICVLTSSIISLPRLSLQVFWFGPALGAIAASLVYTYLFELHPSMRAGASAASSGPTKEKVDAPHEPAATSTISHAQYSGKASSSGGGSDGHASSLSIRGDREAPEAAVVGVSAGSGVGGGEGGLASQEWR